VDYALVGIVLAAVIVLVTADLAARRESERRQLRRLAHVERKVDALVEELGVEVPEPHVERVVALLDQGKTIQAIRAYREETGAGLREAKEAVDRIGGRRRR
jgi:ribosomal protein L7/L12